MSYRAQGCELHGSDLLDAGLCGFVLGMGDPAFGL